MNRKSILGLACALAVVSPVGAEVISIEPAKDNTLYDSFTGALSNGAGMHCFTGITSNESRRRAVLMFDIAGAIPAGSTINSVTLTLNMSRTISGPETQSLHRILTDWGEAGSDASGQEGGGAAALAGDATWLHTFSNGSFWANAGGDFNVGASVSTVVNGVGFYSWSHPQLGADVQDMLISPANNFGWLIMGEEVALGATKRYDTRENPTPANRPALVVDFTPPCPGNLNGDMTIDTADLGILIAQFGTAGSGADFNGDGVVDTADLGILIGVFGSSCP